MIAETAIASFQRSSKSLSDSAQAAAKTSSTISPSSHPNGEALRDLTSAPLDVGSLPPVAFAG